MAFTTRKSLLAKVRAGDEVSWREFYDTYKPLVILCGRDRGLSPDEQDELVQTVMAEVFEKRILEKYDPDKVPEHLVFRYDLSHGRFRKYFRGIVHNKAATIYRKRPKNQSGESEAEEIPGKDQWLELWDDEWAKLVLTMGLAELKNRVQPDTYLAFEMYALQGCQVKEVADFTGMSVTAVYTAKSRCVAKLKEIVAQLEEK